MGLFPFKKKHSNISRSHDVDEFEALLELHLDGMYRVAMRYTRESTAAEDLVHDTVVRALRFRDRFELGTNFKAWIYTVLTHTFMHRYRRQKREREILSGSTRGDVEGQLHSESRKRMAADPENTYLEHMLSDDVLRALDLLSEDFRQVVLLCDIEGLSYKEIADIIDAPVGTVMSRLYRGRRLLEQKLRHVAVEQGIIKALPVEGRQADGQSGAADENSVAVSESRPRSDVFDISMYRRRQSS